MERLDVCPTSFLKKKQIQLEKDCSKKPFRLERFQIEDKVF